MGRRRDHCVQFAARETQLLFAVQFIDDRFHQCPLDGNRKS
jgi:hypothetical protein